MSVFTDHPCWLIWDFKESQVLILLFGQDEKADLRQFLKLLKKYLHVSLR